MFTILKYILSIAFVVGVFSHTAKGAPPGYSQICMEKEKLEEKLEEVSGEVPTMHLVGAGGMLFTLYVNSDTSTWTISGTRDGKLSCVTAVGTDFIPVIPGPEGDPA